MSLSAHSFTSDFTFSCVHSRASQSFADCREDLVLLGVKKHWSCCDASYCTGRRGAQGVCFKLLGLKRGFIFTPASNFCSNNEEIMEPLTGHRRAQCLFLKPLRWKSRFSLFPTPSAPLQQRFMKQLRMCWPARQDLRVCFLHFWD